MCANESGDMDSGNEDNEYSAVEKGDMECGMEVGPCNLFKVSPCAEVGGVLVQTVKWYKLIRVQTAEWGLEDGGLSAL